MAQLKPGGQALADGVFMRTSRAWAVARSDGSVQVGALPVPAMATVPAARVLTGLTVAFKTSAKQGMRGMRGTSITARRSRAANRRFLLTLLAAEGAMLALSTRIPIGELPFLVAVIATVAPWLATLVVLRVAAPSALWRFHGAEHKAVAAFEAGIDLDDVDAVARVSRVHNRCGTNLVTMLALVGIAVNPLPFVVQLPVFAVALALSAELLTLAAARPETWWSRALLAGGRALQRYVTTAEPTRAELAVACQSLSGCLAEHQRVVAEEAVSVAPTRVRLVAA